MKSVIATGKSIDKAIQNALEQLGCSQDEVTIRVISEGGLFKKAEVELTRDNYAEKSQPEKDETANIAKDKTEHKAAAKISAQIAVQEPAKPEKQSEPPKAEAKKITVHLEESHSENVPNKKGKGGKMAVQKQPAARPALNKTSTGANKETIKNFLTELVKFSSAKNAQVNVVEEETHFKAVVSGDALSGLIGSGGETLQAIETVLNVVSGKNRSENKRVMFDVGSYKQSKTDRLIEIANNAAAKVRETKEQFKLRPMTNKERRIVHAHLQTQKDIKTFSKGEEPNRCVVVTLATTEIKEIKE